MHPAEATAVTAVFRHFARHEFAGHSPRYALLSEYLADRPRLASPLLAAPAGQRRPILYLAAVQYLLRTRAAGHPLTDYLPTLGGSHELDDGFPLALAELVTAYHDELTELCATRVTQTNEVRRAALLRPGFGKAARLAGGRPLHLVELGTSAGLLLLTDRYACRYVATDGRTATYGPDTIDAPARSNGATEVEDSPVAGGPGAEHDPAVDHRWPGRALVLECSVRSTHWPRPAAERLVVGGRTGIDQAPIVPSDLASTDWLRACVWPEQTDRLARLDAALEQVAKAPLRLLAGDMVATLPQALAEVSESVLPCVYASNAVTYLDPDARRALVEVLTETGQRRDLAVVLNEAAEAGAELFLSRRPDIAGPPGVLAVGLLTLITWRGGRRHVEPLARTAPHGQWLEWVAGD